jgi:dihydroorotase
MINLETAFSALLHCKPNKLPLSRLLEKFSSTPRQVLGLSQNSITENKEANLTFFSENLEWTYTLENKKSKSKNSPFFGKSMKGKVLGTINKGILNF